ncbi:hypothetical protein [Microbulbifer halophilus]|uniref:hypothetical protein n=1 Tax=Microbulbifer halophilus TaxID=453963 RepID=UPI003616EE1C
MYLNGEAQPSPVGEGTVYTWESTLLQEGDNLLEFYAPGYLDPIATRTVVLTPPPAPVITVTSHTEGEVVTQSPIVLTGTVVNPVESLTIDGIEMPLEGSGFTMEHLDLFEGDNVIEITAKGPGAHAETTTRTLNLFYQSSELPREVWWQALEKHTSGMNSPLRRIYSIAPGKCFIPLEKGGRMSSIRTGHRLKSYPIIE